MTTNGVNGSDPNGVNGWKHYNEGTFLFTVSYIVLRGRPRNSELTARY